jgi:hypothetical protein
MDLNERIEKFNTFLTNFEKASGATGLCEAVRSAAKVCFEGVKEDAPWMDSKYLDPQYRNNVKASYKDLHRKMFHDIPTEKLKQRMAAEKGAKYNSKSDKKEQKDD